MRTAFGITFLKAEIIILLKVSTTKTVRPIPNDENAEEISPRVGQVPKTSIKVGFWKISPFRVIFLYWFIISDLPYFRV